MDQDLPPQGRALVGMDFTVTIEGLDTLTRQTEVTARAVADETAKALYASAQRVEAEAKRSILSGDKSGRIYKRRSVTHRASAPGEAPASDTGRLVNSINSYLDASALASFVVAGRGIVKYAAMLEFGTARMAARPFMFPALEKSKGWIRERLAEGLRRATGGR